MPTDCESRRGPWATDVDVVPARPAGVDGRRRPPYDPAPTPRARNDAIHILGINSNIHDSAACLLKDGALVMAIEEERLSRKKHSKDFPRLAVGACLAAAGIDMDGIDHVAFCFDPWVGLPHVASHFVRTLPGSLLLAKDRAGSGYMDMFRMRRIMAAELSLNGRARKLPFHFVEHHMTHAASVFYPSPFEEAAILSIDGVGEWTTLLLAHGRGSRIDKLKELPFPHSLGLLYQAITIHLGFRGMCDETKVMGLASYGDPSRYRALFERMVHLGADGDVRMDPAYLCYGRYGHVRMLSDRFIAETVPARRYEEPIEQHHHDLAAAVQERLELAGLHVARDLRRRSGSTRLCLAGGVALNSVMNERIRLEAGFDEVFLQPACNDAGTALGAALHIEHAVLGRPRGYRFESPYTGPEYGEDEMLAALRDAGLEHERPADLERDVAAILAEGLVVGWFQGRTEWGPRALGNRSILADPRRADMREILNVKVKHRELFRPFAPVVKLERAGDYFACGMASPYMLFVTEVKPEMRSTIPAVTHVDGTARVQTVTAELNPRLHALLDEFEKLTSVPVLLNTSFNDRGEPIVCSPRDAVRTFTSTKIDVLVLGPFLARKTEH